MKAIARFVFVLFLVCGASVAWKTLDRKNHRFSLPQEAALRPKPEVDPLQVALQPLQSARASWKPENVWSKVEFQAKLEDAFQKNDPCAVMDLLRGAHNVAPREFWASGMTVLLAQSRDSEPLLEELLAKSDSPLYGMPSENSRRVETRFFNALVYSGQLREMDETDDQPRRRGRNNFERSIELFRGLAQEDTDNGAYSFFLASALKQSGASKEEVQAAFNQASKASRFDTFYQSIFDSLQSVAYSNVATFAWAYSFLETMPVPEFSVGIRYLKYWAHNEEAGKWIAQRLAKRLIEVGSKFKAKSPGYQFSHTEYLLGHNLRHTVDGKMEQNWKEYMERMREAETFIGETPRPVVDAQIDLYLEKVEAKKGCGPDAWKALFAAYRAKRES